MNIVEQWNLKKMCVYIYLCLYICVHLKNRENKFYQRRGGLCGRGRNMWWPNHYCERQLGFGAWTLQNWIGRKEEHENDSILEKKIVLHDILLYVMCLWSVECRTSMIFKKKITVSISSKRANLCFPSAIHSCNLYPRKFFVGLATLHSLLPPLQYVCVCVCVCV